MSLLKIEPFIIDSTGSYIFANANITNTGIFGNLTSNGTINFSGASNVTLGSNANLHISGGSSGYVLSTDGSGNLSWASVSSTSVSNGNSNINISTANGNITMTVSGNANIVTVTGTGVNIAGTLNTGTGNLTSGNANLGNLVTANYFSGNGINITNIAGANVSGTVANANYASYSGTVLTNAQPNITSVGTLTSLDITGNLTSGNANLGNLATANYFTGNGINITNIAGANVSGTVANANYALYSGTVLTNAQPNITSVGTLSGLSIGGNIIPSANITYDLGNNTNRFKDLYLSGNTIYLGNANITASGSGDISITGKLTGDGGGLSNIVGANVTGTVANATYAISAGSATTAGTVTTNAQPNITSVGTLSSLSITGNLSSGNATLGNLASANYFSGNGSLLTSITGANVTGTVANATYATSAGSATTAGTVTTNSQPNITSVGTLSSLIVTGDANAGNFNTSGVLTAGDATITGNLTVNGTTIYANVTTLNVKDPIIEMGGNPNGTPLSTNDGKDRGTLLHYYTGSTATDAFMGWDNSNAEFAFGSNVTLSSEVATFNTFGNVRASYFLGNGSQLTGIIATGGNANYANYAGTVLTNAQPNITSVGTLTSLDITGNLTSGNANLGNLVTANYFTGNGINITNIAGANVSGTVANANYALYAGTVLTNSQPNITSVGTLTSLDITGNLTSGNANLGNLVTANYFSGNGINLTNIAGANVSGTVANATSAGNATTAGTVTTNAQPNITSLGTLTSLDITGTTTSGNFATAGNITASFLVSNIATGTAPLTVASNTKVTNLNADLLDGYDTATAATANTVAVRDANGNISANFFIGNGSQLTGITTTSTSLVNGNSNVVVAANSNITMTVSGNANIVTVTGTGVNIAGTLNIGNGQFTTTGNANASSFNATSQLVSSVSTGTAPLSVTSTTRVANLNVSYSNVSDYEVVTTQTTGTFYPTFVSGNTTGNYALASNTALSFNAATGTLTTGNISAGSGSGGNITGANLVSANYFTGTLTTNAQPNITSVGTLSNLTVTGTTTSGNFATAGNITASFLVSNVATGTAPLTVASNTKVTNLNADLLDGYDTATANTANTVAVRDANGNISANFFIGNGSQLTGISATPGGSNTYVQFNDSSSFGGTAGLTFDKSSNALAANGSITGTTLVSNISTGTAPLTVTSTTRVSNLSVAYANVSDYEVVTTQTTGTFYPTFVSGNTTGNYALASNTAISFNAANGTLTTGNISTGGGTGGSITGANLMSANYFSGTLTTASQPNITSIGTLSSLTVTGTTTSGNFATAGNITASFLVSNIATGTAPLTVTSNTKVTNLNADLLDGYDTATAATANTVAVRDANGNISANFFIGNGSQLTGITVAAGSSIVNGNSNIVIAANSNITMTVAGNASIVTVTGTGVNVAGTLNIGNGQFTTTGNANVANLNATGIYGAIQTASQTNITSLGTLGSLSVTGLTTATGGVKTANIQDTTGVVTIVTGYSSVAGDVGIYGNLAVGTSGTGNISAVNASLGNLATANYVNAKVLNSNIAVGTAPLSVVSTTRVANLSVAYSNVSDYGVVTAQTTGTFYPVFASGSTTANYALAANANVNVAIGTGIVSATGFTATGTVTGATVFANSHTANGAVSGNANVSTVTGNLGIRAIASTYTDNVVAASTTVANAAAHAIGIPTMAASNATVTFTNSSTLYIAGAPTAGTNVTQTNPYALYIASGNMYSVGNIQAANFFYANGTAVGSGGGGGGSSISNVNSNVNIASANGNIQSVVASTIISNISASGYDITGAVDANSITVTGAYSGNANVSTVTGNLGLRTIASTYTDNVVAASTTIANAAAHAFGVPTLAATNATVTFTNASTLFIANVPTAGTNVTLTNRYALHVANGNVLIASNILAGGFYYSNGTAFSASPGGSNTHVQFNDASAFGGTAGLTFDKTTNTLSVANSISTGTGSAGTISGAAVFSGASHTITGAYSGNANVSTVTGNLGLRAIASTYTDNVVAASTTVANAAAHAIGIPTMAASNATVTFTNSSTLYIAGPPTAGTNVTQTNPYSLYIASGNMYSVGNVQAANFFYANGTAVGGGGGGATLTDNTSTNANTYYPVMANNQTSGSLSAVVSSSTKMYFNPSTGTLNATIFNSLSDETQKTNIQRITDALSKMKTLGGYTYLMIDSNEPSAGLLAQEVQKVLPEATKYNPDTKLLSLNYNAVLGMVVEAINELEERVKRLENDGN